MDNELKPCPHCGGEAANTHETTYYTKKCFIDKHWVFCKECFASSGKYETEAEANAAWNKRTDDKQ